MNRRSFINKVIQGGAVVATGLPEKLLSSEASAFAVDKEGIKLTMEVTHGNVGLAPNPINYTFVISTPRYPEDNYVYVGEPVAPNVEMRYRNGWFLSYLDEEEKIINKNRFVHKKYFLVALLKGTENTPKVLGEEYIDGELCDIDEFEVEIHELQ
jgi:hypothetical protein